MKFFIDTANVDEIKEAVSLGVLDGVTTNPTLLKRCGLSLNKIIEEIFKIVDGPISLEVIGDKAAQRVNTFASAILCGMDVETFRKLETAYAPSIAPTLDAITIVCDIVSKKLKLNK